MINHFNHRRRHILLRATSENSARFHKRQCVQCSLILVAVFFSTLLLYSMKNKENVVDSVVKVTIDHTSESKQDVIQASQKLLHFLSKTTSSNSIVKKHKGKKYCCIAREKHFDSSNVTSSLNVCVEMLAK